MSVEKTGDEKDRRNSTIVESNEGSYDVETGEIITDNADQLLRRLGNRQIQLMAIGGSIGTALFISIGYGLSAGGPLSLFLTYAFYSCIMGLVNNCAAEMAVLHPVSGGFVRMAGHWVDDAFGFFAGWNFFLYEALVIPFEITALTLVLSFWRDDIPPAAVIATSLVLYLYLTHISVPVEHALTVLPGFSTSLRSRFTAKQNSGYPVAKSSCSSLCSFCKKTECSEEFEHH